MDFIGEHYQGIHKPFPITLANVKEFDTLLQDENCNIFDRIKVSRRIGSESVYATVWEVDFMLNKRPIKMAIKIQKDVEKTLNEIEINNFLKTWPKYFLQMYGSIYCEKIQLKDDSFDGYFMFMELAISDLAQLITLRDVSETDLIHLIDQVMDSIYVLGKNQLFHGDLHIRNVFIVPRGNDIRAVIGDFGETIGIDSITSHTSDIYKFASSLLEFLDNFDKYYIVKSKLKDIMKYVNRLSVQLENDYDKWNETYRDEEGEVNYEELDAYFENVVGNTIQNVKKILLN